MCGKGTFRANENLSERTGYSENHRGVLPLAFDGVHRGHQAVIQTAGNLALSKACHEGADL